MNAIEYLPLILMCIPFLGFLFVLTIKNQNVKSVGNAIATGEFTVFANTFVLIFLLSRINLEQKGLQFISSYQWINYPPIKLVFGVDVFSLMLALAIHVVFLIMIPMTQKSIQQKSLVALSLFMLSLLIGFLFAADILSFYIFFVALLIPLFLLIGIAGEVRKTNWILRFFIYNFIGCMALFLVVCALIHCAPEKESILLNQVAKMRLPRVYEYWIWGGLFIALLSRIPIWPFHYWISSMTSTIQNPQVFLLINLMPLTGVYGLVRFCTKTVPESVTYFLTGLEVISAISIIFIAMIGLINKDGRYKLFSFITVYYIIFMLGALLPTNRILLNIGYALFAFLIIVSALEMFASYIREEQRQYNVNLYGALCQTPRLAVLYSFFTLAAVGFPLSALFINNFIILSYLFSYNFNLGIIIVFTIVISSASLLKELYLLKDARYIQPGSACITDISYKTFIGLSFVGILLLVSFINPLLVLGG